MNPDHLGRLLPVVHTHADRYIKWIPAAALFAARPSGIKTANDPLRQLLLLAFNQAMHTAATKMLKENISRYRPGLPLDFRSFPSSHTSTAFANAEMLRKELFRNSPAVAWTGYLPALVTALMRISKRRHWPSDVLAGAAIGVASTAFTYWIFRQIMNDVPVQKGPQPQQDA